MEPVKEGNASALKFYFSEAMPDIAKTKMPPKKIRGIFKMNLYKRLFAVSLFEFVNSTCSINKFHFAGKEWVRLA